MAKTDDRRGFKEKQRVEAAVELPGVPEGTRGKVIEVSGLTWVRYRVDFDNGVSQNLIDAAKLRPVKGRA